MNELFYVKLFCMKRFVIIALIVVATMWGGLCLAVLMTQKAEVIPYTIMTVLSLFFSGSSYLLMTERRKIAKFCGWVMFLIVISFSFVSVVQTYNMITHTKICQDPAGCKK